MFLVFVNIFETQKKSLLYQKMTPTRDIDDVLFEPVNEISKKVVCATSKASDYPAHTRSLIRAFTSRLNIL